LDFASKLPALPSRHFGNCRVRFVERQIRALHEAARIVLRVAAPFFDGPLHVPRIKIGNRQIGMARIIIWIGLEQRGVFLDGFAGSPRMMK